MTLFYPIRTIYNRVIIVVVALLLVQCSSSEQFSADDPTANDTTVKSGVVSPLTLQTIQLNQLSGLSADGNNALKLQDVCINSKGVVGIGIITTTVPIWSDGELQTIKTTLSEGFSYKNVFCGEDYAFVVTEQQVSRIDLESKTETGLIDLSQEGQTIWYESSYYDEAHQRLFLQVHESDTEPAGIRIYSTSTLQLLATIQIDLANIHIKSNGDILLMNTSGSKKAYVYDTTTYALKSTTSIAYSYTKTAFNPTTNELWWFQSGTRTAWYMDLDTVSSGAKSISGLINNPIKIEYAAGYVTILCENCYDSGEDGEARGAVTVINATTKQKVFDKSALYEHKSMSMEATSGTIALTNNNNMSTTLIELPSGDSETIDLGDGYEWMVVDKTGNVHLVNRVGGDTIMSLNPVSKTASSVSTLMWPLGVNYDSDRNQLITFNHLGNAISFYDVSQSSASLDLDKTYNLSGISEEAELDALGDIAYDDVNDVVYVTVPEYNQLIITKSSSDIDVMELPDYLGGDYSDLKGPGILTLEFSSTHQILFVHIRDTNTVYAYDVNDDMRLIKTLTMSVTDNNVVYPLTLVADTLYVGSKSYQLPAMTQGTSLVQGEYVVAVDSEFNTFFTVGQDDTTHMQTLYVIDGNTQEVLSEIELWTMNVVSAVLAYDDERGLMYVLNMEDATLRQIQIYE